MHGSHENAKEKEKNGAWWRQPPRDLHEWEVMMHYVWP